MLLALAPIFKNDNPVVLELGCGPGNLSKQLLSLRPDLKITATDLAPDMLEIAQETNPSIVC